MERAKTLIGAGSIICEVEYSMRRRKRLGRVHILILVENLPVPFDRRVWQESLALAGAGYAVHVICPATKEYPKRRETIGGISIYRYRAGPEARRSAAYLVEYGIAIFAQLRIALGIRLRYQIKLVHICNPPDLLFLVALPLMALGSSLIYDHHDACPELMIAKGHSVGSRFVRLAKIFERLTYRFASVSIETNESYRQIALARGGMCPEDVFVVRSAPAANRFTNPRVNEKWRNGKEYLVAYVGVMGLQDGLDYLIDAASVMIQDWDHRNVQFVLVGTGPEFPRLRDRVCSLGIESFVTFTGRLPDEDLGSVLTTADLCVNPDEANAMNDISTMNKILEYMTVGKPMVQFDLHEGRISAGNASLYAARNDATSLASCIMSLLENQETRNRMGRIGQERFTLGLNWESQVPLLLDAYRRALSKSMDSRGDTGLKREDAGIKVNAS